MNKVILIGNVGQAPVLKYAGDRAVLKFRMATTEYVGKAEDGTTRTRTEWHNVTVWGKRAESLASCIHKGSLLSVEGRIRSNSYTGKDGTQRRDFAIESTQIELLTRKPTSDKIEEVSEQVFETGEEE